MPCVDITLKDGKHLRMLVGLGEVNSVLDSAVAKDLGLPINPVSTPDSPGAIDPGRESSVLDGVRLGEASLGDIPVVVVDIASSIERSNSFHKQTEYSGTQHSMIVCWK